VRCFSELRGTRYRRYRHILIYEYDEVTLRAEAAQEVADAINHIARRRVIK
jgi:hypothetical protein